MKTLEQAVRDLPHTEQGVVRLLRENGIRGGLGEACRCPIAILLTKLTGLPEGKILVGAYYVGQIDVVGHYALPPGAVEFIAAFDIHRKYADLRSTHDR